jgi:hypothetical protein
LEMVAIAEHLTSPELSHDQGENCDRGSSLTTPPGNVEHIFPLRAGCSGLPTRMLI